MNLSELEKVCMEMIGSAGEGKAKLFEAMDAYDAGNVEQSKKLLEEANKHIGRAHEIQFMELMAKQSSGEEIPFNLLLIHAMDILANAAMQMELINRKLSF